MTKFLSILQDDMNMEVVICPDYFVYQDEYSTEAVVSFSNSGIKIKGSIGCEKKGSFNFQWELDDIIDIGSHWCGRVGLKIIVLRPYCLALLLNAC